MVRLNETRYQLSTSRWLGTPRQFRIGPTFLDRLGPVEKVADAAPRVVHGILQDQTPVTLVDASMNFDDNTDQHFTGHRLVRGVHLAQLNEPITAARWEVTGVHGLGCATGQAHAARGHLTGEPGRHGPTLTFHATHPTPLREISDATPTAVSALCSLWTLQPVAHTRVSLIGNPTWFPLEPTPQPRPPQTSDLLPAQDLTTATIAGWLDIATELGSLPFVATTSNPVIQNDAHAMGSALEGLHRRLHRATEPPFHSLTRSAVDTARAQAAEAAAAYLHTRGWVDPPGEPTAHLRFKDATTHVNQISYAERLTTLLHPVLDVAPGLCGPDQGEPFITAMTKLRNEQAHHFLAADQFDDPTFTKYYVLAKTARWALRLRILLETTTPERLHEALRRSSQFGFALANIDRDPFWPSSFSVYRTFTAG